MGVCGNSENDEAKRAQARDDGALQRPEVKLAVKLRYLELHAARLGFEKVTLQIIDEPSAAPSVPAFAPNGVAAAREPPVHAVDLLEELPASALLHSSHLDPKTWALLRREVPPIRGVRARDLGTRKRRAF